MGRGVKQDPKQADEWLLRAAEQDHPEAQYALGENYAWMGDFEQSRYWTRRAAENGHVEASIYVEKWAEMDRE